MKRIVGWACVLTLLGIVPAGGPAFAALEEIEFSGHVAFIYTCKTDCSDDKMTEVLAFLVDSRKVDLSQASHKRRAPKTSHVPLLVIEDAGWTSPAPDEFLGGFPVWNLTGKEVTFAGTSADVTFERGEIADLGVAHEKSRDLAALAGLRRAAVLIKNGGTLLASGDRQKLMLRNGWQESCRAERDLVESLIYRTEIPSIKFDSTTLTLKDGTRARILNAPIYHDEAGDHFREFYELTEPGHKLPWLDRCTLYKDAKDAHGDAFCPPIVLGKGP